MIRDRTFLGVTEIKTECHDAVIVFAETEKVNNRKTRVLASLNVEKDMIQSITNLTKNLDGEYRDRVILAVTSSHYLYQMILKSNDIESLKKTSRTALKSYFGFFLPCIIWYAMMGWKCISQKITASDNNWKNWP